MVDIDQLLHKLNKTEVEVPDYLYKNISQSIKLKREQKNKKFIRINTPKVYLRYAFIFTALLIIGLVYFYSVSMPVTVIEERGHIIAATAHHEWQRLEGKKIKQGCYRTGNDSDILIQFGRHLSVRLIGENHFKIKKLRRFFGYKKYEIHLYKGNQIYNITKKNSDILIVTDDIKLKHIGTKFNIAVDKAGTYIKVLKGKVAIKRNLKNKEKINVFQYKNDSCKKSLQSLFKTETIITKGGYAYVSKKGNKKIENFIDKIANENKIIDKEVISRIEKNISIKPQREKLISWEYNIKTPVWASPFYYKGYLYFGMENGYVISLSKNGKLKWKRKIGTSFINNGIVYKNKFYIVDSKGILFAINIINGRIIWKKYVGKVMYSAPVIKYKKLFIATTSGKIITLQIDSGKVTWQMKLKSGIFCQPIVEKEKIYIGCEDGIVYCINYLNSNIKWKMDTGFRIAIASPTIYKNIIYIGNNKGVLFAIDKNKGKTLWKKKLNDKILSMPIIKNGFLFTATANGMIYSMNLKGQIKWKLHLKENIEASFEIADNKMIFSTRYGNVYIINKNKGTIYKIIKLNDEIISSPVIKNGFIYITTLNGKIYKCSIEKKELIATK